MLVQSSYWEYSWGMTIDDFPQMKREEMDWEREFFDQYERGD